MPWPLWPLQQLWVVLVPVLFLVGEQWGRSEQRRRVRSSARPRWSRAGSSVAYTPAEVRTLTPVRESVEKRASLPHVRDVFLCHAWDDRGGAAKDLHDLLESRGVSVWFSEKDVALGTSLLREIDKGLAKSRVGIVLVTPALLLRVQGEGIADKELSATQTVLVPHGGRCRGRRSGTAPCKWPGEC
jgi:hypothetical protein